MFVSGDVVMVRTVEELHTTLSQYAFPLQTQIFKCGAEDLTDGEFHGDRVGKLNHIYTTLLSYHWDIHAVYYAYQERHVEWVLYATRYEEANADLQESLDRWIYYRRAKGMRLCTIPF